MVQGLNVLWVGAEGVEQQLSLGMNVHIQDFLSHGLDSYRLAGHVRQGACISVHVGRVSINTFFSRPIHVMHCWYEFHMV